MFPLLHFLYILQDSFRIDESYFLFKGSLDVVGAIQDGDVNLWKLVLWSVQWGSINALAYRFMQKVLDKRYAFLTKQVDIGWVILPRSYKKNGHQ